jgi:superfamily II DNA or RNA helicase
MTPFATWRARLPAQVASWFSRDLVRNAMSFVEGKRVAIRVVEDAKIESTIRDPRFSKPIDVMVEWSGGTGPLALRPVCSCGGSGVCEHIVATLEALRLHEDLANEGGAGDEIDWLPAPRFERSEPRARSIWPVFTLSGDGAMTATLVLDSPRLRGAVRDAPSIVAMMESTPPDDWDEFDREFLRDETILETFTGRTAGKALARALFRLARHPRVRFDDNPPAGRHPSELPEFEIDLRGLRLRAANKDGHFVPLLEDNVGRRIDPATLVVLDGPPTWAATPRAAYLLDNSFDIKRVQRAARHTNGVTVSRPAASAIARVAPFLVEEDRAALGIVDAIDPEPVLELSWNRGALLAKAFMVERGSGARAPITPYGAIVQHEDRYVRFSSRAFAETRARLLRAGFVPRGNEGFALHSAERAAEFVLLTLPEWDDIRVELDNGLGAFAAGRATVGVSIGASVAGDAPGWFDLELDALIDGSAEPLTRAELQKLLASSTRYADVRGRLVDISTLRENGALLADLSEQKRTGFAALLALRDELKTGFADVRLPDEIERLRERLRDFSGIDAIEAPQLHTGALRSYQRRGLDFLAYLASFGFGGILADDMGTGKTLTTISYLLYRLRKDGRSPSLVIAPTSVTHTWENEILRFAPELKTLRLSSGSERAERYEEIPGVDVVITSYALARLDAERLGTFRFRTLILDEAQNAKNPSSQIARVVRALQAEHRLALTGTPVENSLRDLWSVFSIVEPGLLGSEGSFKRRFEVPIASGDEGAVRVLHQRLEPFLLRRTKEDVAPELPDRTEVLLECDLSPLQRRLYRGLAEAARRELLGRIDEDGGVEKAAIHVLAALTRLRQVCAHPGLIFEEHRNEAGASAKFDAFLETIEEVLSGGHRVLVFSAFASMLRIMREEFDRRSVPLAYLDGSTKDRERQEEVERFMRPDGPPVFLCSLKAGGVGLTLTAADYVVLYDPWWNPAIERQAIDRTHRIGQHKPVTAYRLVTLGTVEEKIRQLAERKAGLAKSVIKADAAFAKSLSRADIELLLADPG